MADASATPMTSIPLPEDLAADLEQVERLVRERTHSRAAVISVAGPHLYDSDTPRLRAALVLLCAALGAYQRERVLHPAAAVELIHAATRTHDSLIDPAERRRGVAPAGEWGHGVPLMVGDYLFALAAGEMALSPDPRVISFYAQAVMQISEAELGVVRVLRPLDEARAQYFEHAGGATAALFRAACMAGAAVAGLDESAIGRAGDFGESLGLALHIAAELREDNPARPGTVSLALIYAADAANQADAARLAEALDSGDPAEIQWAAAFARHLGAAPTRAACATYAAAARAALAALPDTPARALLYQLAEV